MAKKVTDGPVPLFRPINGTVLLRWIEVEDKSLGKLVLPDAAKKKSRIGKVVAVDPDSEEKLVQVGETVYFPQFEAEKIQLDGLEYVIVPEKDLLGVLE